MNTGENCEKREINGILSHRLKQHDILNYVNCTHVPSGSGTIKPEENDDVAPDVEVAVMIRLWLPGLNLVKSMAKFREPT